MIAAILADEGLGERQKQVLVDIYESFRRENAQLAAGEVDAGVSGIDPASVPAAGE